MDPTTICPISRALPEAKLARGTLVSTHAKTSASSVRSAVRPSPRRKGRLLPPADTSRNRALVLTLLAHGCPLQTIVVAFGFDERTVAAWWARSGRQGQAVQECLVEQPRDLGHVQADEIRVKKQGGIVWMALAMMVKTRLWLGGEVSEQRDMPLIRRLIERVRRCAAHRPLLVCTDGLVSYIRAVRETFRDPVHTGTGGRPRLRPWRTVLIAQVVKRYERRRVVETERRIIDGTPARVEALRRRSQGDGGINTAYIERLNATFRERLVSLTRRGRALARRTLTLQHGMYLIGTVYNFCTPHASLTPTSGGTTPAMAAGITDHAGPSRNCCRFMCHRRVGRHPRSEGVPHSTQALTMARPRSCATSIYTQKHPKSCFLLPAV